jgi:hypothetical protein
MDMRMLGKLIRLMGASTLSELEIREGGGMVRICRDPRPAESPGRVGASQIPKKP